MLDLYVVKDGKKLRCGYTTGSCATAASKAAAWMLEYGQVLEYIEIETPAGVDLKLEVKDVFMGNTHVSCGIVKDAGDDPDNTDGIEVFAEVRKRTDGNIHIDGGEGVGRITKKGLFGEVGEAAINPVPRKMIVHELKKISDSGFDVIIYVPRGAEVGKKTFNANIGIEGGISIIGTKGIVYPMSDEALVKTIYMEIDAIRENAGAEELMLVLGNYGENLARDAGILLPTVKVSNFIGDALSYAYEKGFRKLSILGHVGKLSKLSIGIFNTHNRTADTRLESFVYYLSLKGADPHILEQCETLTTAEQAVEFLIEKGYQEIIRDMEKGAELRVRRYLKDPDVEVHVRIYSMEKGLEIC